jgi:hypothetical protein
MRRAVSTAKRGFLVGVDYLNGAKLGQYCSPVKNYFERSNKF